MSFKVRLSKLEKVVPTTATQVEIIFREIVWADGTVIGAMAKVRTHTGWQTLTRADGETDVEFRARANAL